MSRAEVTRVIATCRKLMACHRAEDVLRPRSFSLKSACAMQRRAPSGMNRISQAHVPWKMQRHRKKARRKRLGALRTH